MRAKNGSVPRYGTDGYKSAYQKMKEKLEKAIAEHADCALYLQGAAGYQKVMEAENKLMREKLEYIRSAYCDDLDTAKEFADKALSKPTEAKLCQKK